MILQKLMISLLALSFFTCGSDGGGSPSPAPTDNSESQNNAPSMEEAQGNSGEDIPAATIAEISGLYGMTQDHMIEFYDSGDYRFYTKNPIADGYLIEQGTYVVNGREIEINPTYTSCMSDGQTFKTLKYNFSAKAGESITLEKAEFPTINGVDTGALSESACSAAEVDQAQEESN